MKKHDTFVDLARGTPMWFTLSARGLPLGILGQFLSAGTALFQNGEVWGLHAAVGGVLLVPAAVVFGGSLLIQRLRGFGWWAGLVVILCLTQVALAAGSQAILLSLHPLNGALLLSASLILLTKVERRRAQPPNVENAA